MMIRIEASGVHDMRDVNSCIRTHTWMDGANYNFVSNKKGLLS